MCVRHFSATWKGRFNPARKRDLRFRSAKRAVAIT
jgi:hypothetical protein